MFETIQAEVALNEEAKTRSAALKKVRKRKRKEREKKLAALSFDMDEEEGEDDTTASDSKKKKMSSATVIIDKVRVPSFQNAPSYQDLTNSQFPSSRKKVRIRPLTPTFCLTKRGRKKRHV